MSITAYRTLMSESDQANRTAARVLYWSEGLEPGLSRALRYAHAAQVLEELAIEEYAKVTVPGGAP